MSKKTFSNGMKDYILTYVQCQTMLFLQPAPLAGLMRYLFHQHAVLHPSVAPSSSEINVCVPEAVL